MTGFRYWRRKRRMTLQELAQASGCTTAFLITQERKVNPSASSALVAAVAGALGVTMDELFQEYPEETLVGGDHAATRSRTQGQALNVIGQYRLAHNLTYLELATRLGQASRQAARSLCISPHPSPRFLERLAGLEDLKVEEFLCRYLA